MSVGWRIEPGDTETPHRPRSGLRFWCARVSTARAALAILVVGVFAAPAAAQLTSRTLSDRIGDAAIRRPDGGADGPVDGINHRLPDIVSCTIGPWQPADATTDLFTGAFANAAGFFRLDLVFDGLVNPPGTTGCCNAPFDPFKYGDHPVFGYVELDMDASEHTGGELELPRFTYLGNVARFGGLPQRPYLADRAARDASAFDANILTPPLVDRSGEEFHLALHGWEIVNIHRSNDENAVFDPGETWIVQGYLFQRAHGYRKFSYACCLGPPGSYDPLVRVRFAHRVQTDRTTVSLVYPLTNADAASALGAGDATLDGDPANVNSVLEGLDDLVLGATFPAAEWLDDPDFAIIQDWAQYDLYPGPNDVTQLLDPRAWRVNVIVATSYTNHADDPAQFVWTDAMPDPLPGDFDGDGAVTWRDLVRFSQFVSLHDGQASVDADGTVNCAVELVAFGPNFSLFDVNYDGRVDSADAPVLPVDARSPGDLDGDGDGDQADFGLMQACIGRSTVTSADPVCHEADLDLDHDVDADDLALFEACSTAPGVRADPTCGTAGVSTCSGSRSR